MPSKDDVERVKTGQIDHIGVDLWRANHAFVSLMMARLAARGYRDITLAHSSLLPHLDLEGTRITELAARSGLTKQAIGQMVTELERRGYVSRQSDPSDGRAKIVRYTDKGLRFIGDSQSIKRELDETCRRALGGATYSDLEGSLRTLVATLQDETS